MSTDPDSHCWFSETDARERGFSYYIIDGKEVRVSNAAPVHIDNALEEGAEYNASDAVYLGIGVFLGYPEGHEPPLEVELSGLVDDLSDLEHSEFPDSDAIKGKIDEIWELLEGMKTRNERN